MKPQYVERYYTVTLAQLREAFGILGQRFTGNVTISDGYITFKTEATE